ncbi:Ornithine carbamoyltransferase, partial [Geodia barretti]
ETRRLIEDAAQGKSLRGRSPLAGKSVALLFEKPSLRTKVSFQVAVEQLGGYSLYMGGEEVGLGVREPVSDVARVLSGYVDCIVARVFRHEDLQELATYASVPVINALSDWEHPCQAMADLLTIHEHKGGLDGRTLAYIGDGNNVARSLCLALPAVGMNFNCASPVGYDLDEGSVAAATGRGIGAVRTMRSPVEAVADADIVYTDVWASMGQEAEAEQRRLEFAGYTVDPALMAQARPGALFMHDMPAHYGEEVPPGMLEHPQSVAYPQAHNRLHAQKAVLEFLLGDLLTSLVT